MFAMEESTAEMRRSIYHLISNQGSLLEMPALEGIVQLCMLPYFQRGWIQQEVDMPRTLMFMLCLKTIGAEVFTTGMYFHLVYFTKSDEKVSSPAILAIPLA